MGFNAGDTEPLDYDFTTLKSKVTGLENSKGTVPEPSIDAVQTFFNEMAINSRETGDKIDALSKGLPDDAPLTHENSEAMREIVDESHQERCRLLAALCSNQPSYDELILLPHRIYRGFEDWLVAAMRPEAERAATT